MKSRSPRLSRSDIRFNLRGAVMLGAVLATSSAFSATIQKNNDTTDPLNVPAAWVGGVVPGGSDVAFFDTLGVPIQTVTGGAATTSTYTLGGDLTFGQLALFIQPTISDATLNINNATGATNTLTLNGVNGIGINNLSFQPVGSGNKNAQLTINTNVAAANSQIWQTTTRQITVTGAISGGSGVTITKNGAGLFIIGSANSATVNPFAGTFVIGGNASTAIPATINTQFSGLGTLSVTGSTLNLNQNNTYTGYTGVDQVNNTAALNLGSGNLTITGKATTTVSQTFASTALNTGHTQFSLVNQGTGSSVTLNLNAITRTAGGTFDFLTPANAGTSTLTTTTGTANSLLRTTGGIAYGVVGATTATNWAAKDATNTSVVAFTGYTTATTLTSANNGQDVNLTAGAQTLTSNVAPATLRLADAATVTVNAGGFAISTGGILAASNTGQYSLSNGTLTALAGTQELVLINSGTQQINVGTVVTDNSGGAVSLTTGGSGTVNITTAGTYTGDTYIGSGTFRMNGAGVGDANSTYHVGGNATFNVNNQTNISVGGLTGYGQTTLGTGALTVGANNASTTYDGQFTSSATTASLIKTGTGILRLTAFSNTNQFNYTGAVTVNGGTLLVNGSLASAGVTTVNNGGTLGGTGAVAAITTAAASGGTFARISPGDGSPGTLAGNGIGALTGTNLNLGNGTHLAFELSGSGTTSDVLNLSGTLTADSASSTYIFDFTGGVVGNVYTLVNFASTNATAAEFAATGDTGTFNLTGTTLTFMPATVAVPEPSTWVAGVLCLGALGVSLRRRSLKG